MIISDIHLQNGGNVFDFLRWVKKNPSTCDTPFVMLSSEPTSIARYIEDGLRTSARLLGVTKYITMENFDSDEFCKQIDLLLAPGDQAIVLSTTGKDG
jgi:CheY-like chemotaxis protein